MISFTRVLLNKRNYLLKLFDLSYWLIIDILFLSDERLLVFLEVTSKIKFLKDEIDIIFDRLYKYTIFFEKFYAVIIDIIVWLVILFDSYIHLVFIDNFGIVHMLINEVLKDLSCFFSEVQKIFVVTISEVLQLSTVEKKLPNWWKTFESILVKIQFLKVWKVKLCVCSLGYFIVIEIESFEARQKEDIQLFDVVVR